MPTAKKRPDLYGTEEGARIEEALKSMSSDSGYSTIDSYSANAETHPDHLVSFVDKHMAYLQSHPSVDAEHYLANLRLMTRVR
jgi:hypothetical protein